MIYKLPKIFGLCHKSPKQTKIMGNYKQDSVISNLLSEIKYLSMLMQNLHQKIRYFAMSIIKLCGAPNLSQRITQSHYEILHFRLQIVDCRALFFTHVNFGWLRTYLSKSENFSELITQKPDKIFIFWNRHEIELKKLVVEIQGQTLVVLSRVAPEVTAFILENTFTTEPPKSKSTIEKKPLRYICVHKQVYMLTFVVGI